MIAKRDGSFNEASLSISDIDICGFRHKVGSDCHILALANILLQCTILYSRTSANIQISLLVL